MFGDEIVTRTTTKGEDFTEASLKAARLADEIVFVFDKSVVRAKIKEFTDVLEAIEEIVSHSDTETIQMHPERFTDKEVKLASIIGRIYMLAHAHAGHCGSPHTDWLLKK